MAEINQTIDFQNKSEIKNLSISQDNFSLNGLVLQKAILPIATAVYVGRVVQYIGVDGTYQYGSFYKCIFDESIQNYRWNKIGESGGSVIDEVEELPANPDLLKIYKLSKAQGAYKAGHLYNAFIVSGGAVRWNDLSETDFEKTQWAGTYEDMLAEPLVEGRSYNTIDSFFTYDTEFVRLSDMILLDSETHLKTVPANGRAVVMGHNIVRMGAAFSMSSCSATVATFFKVRKEFTSSFGRTFVPVINPIYSVCFKMGNPYVTFLCDSRLETADAIIYRAQFPASQSSATVILTVDICVKEKIQ